MSSIPAAAPSWRATRRLPIRRPAHRHGHKVEVMSETSGLHAIAIMKDGLHGAPTAVREGLAVGE